MRNVITRSAGILVGIYLLVLVLLFTMQRSLVFQPNPNRIELSAANLPDVREVMLETNAGEKLICWFGPARQGQPTFLYFHGNGGNIGNRQASFKQLMAKGFGVFMLGYPGYGGSDGSPSEDAFMEAAQLSYDHLIDQGIPASDIVLYGQSLGSCVAVQMAARVGTRALVLVSPMRSVLDVASSQYPYLPVRWLLRDPFRSDLHIDDVWEPLLVIHGDRDRIIPISQGQSLFERAAEPKVFETVAHAGHNNLYDFSIVDRIERFLDQHSNTVAVKTTEDPKRHAEVQ